MPVGLSEEEQNYILMHEQTHIQRKDHIIKILAFLIASIHWFNPWYGCLHVDEHGYGAVLRRKILQAVDEGMKSPTPIPCCPLPPQACFKRQSLAFGEGNVKSGSKSFKL